MDLSAKYDLFSSAANKVSAARLKAIGLVVVVSLTFLVGKLYFKPTEVSVEPYVKVQWHNIYLFTGPFQSFDVPLILFDIEALPKLTKARREIWHDPPYTCRVLCKHHPNGNNLVTFAVLARKFIPQQEKIVDRLKKVRFATHLSEVPDPRLHDADNIHYIPTYLWLAQKDHVIQIVVLHERQDDYYWVGPVTDEDWHATVEALKPQMTIDWRTLNGAVFPRHAQAYDKSYHLAGVSTKIDSYNFVVPYRISQFLEEHEKSYFIECNQKEAFRYHINHPHEPTMAEVLYQTNAKNLLRTARKVLTKMKIPFWLSSGTLLGWYRECGIIPHGLDVDIGVWIHDYHPDIIEQMEKQGLMLKNIFGKVEDSYEISFVDSDGVKLDIFFFYSEDNYAWNGGTRAHDGAKFKYTFPQFTLCWTEFLEMKFRVPCETASYIEANYGPNWRVPVKKWSWYASPPNVIEMGYWDKSEWEQVIQIFEPLKTKPVREKEL